MPDTTAWCIDIDGTLILYNKAIEGASNFLNELNISNTPYVILTNTGVNTSADVSRRLQNILEIEVDYKKIFTSCDNMIKELKSSANEFDNIYVVNSSNILNKLDISNATEFKSTMHTNQYQYKTCIAIFSDGYIENYYDVLQSVANYAFRGAHIWITSQDSTLMKQVNDIKVLQVGPGAFVSALKCMVPNANIKTFGKGANTNSIDSIVAQLVKQGFRGSLSDIIMLGDRFYTDMKFGISNHTRTLLVESGCDNEKSNHYLQKKIDMIATSINDIPCELSNTRIASIKQFIKRNVMNQLSCLLKHPLAHLSLQTVVERAENALSNPPRRIRSAPYSLHTWDSAQ